jgi:hypothetical protein
MCLRSIQTGVGRAITPFANFTDRSMHWSTEPAFFSSLILKSVKSAQIYLRNEKTFIKGLVVNATYKAAGFVESDNLDKAKCSHTTNWRSALINSAKIRKFSFVGRHYRWRRYPSGTKPRSSETRKLGISSDGNRPSIELSCRDRS